MIIQHTASTIKITKPSHVSLALLTQILNDHRAYFLKCVAYEGNADSAIIKLCSFETKAIGQGEGFLGCIVKIIVRFQVQVGTHHEATPEFTASLVAKFAPVDQNETFEQFFKPMRIFERESQFYASVRDQIISAQSVCSQIEQKNSVVPICFFVSLDEETGQGAILMEDIHQRCGPPSGDTDVPRRTARIVDFSTGFSLEQMKATLRMVALVHSRHWTSLSGGNVTKPPPSLLCLPESGSIFQELVACFYNDSVRCLVCIAESREQRDVWLAISLGIAIPWALGAFALEVGERILGCHCCWLVPYISKLKQFRTRFGDSLSDELWRKCEQVGQRVQQIVSPSQRKCNCLTLCHGDLWSNNVLFYTPRSSLCLDGTSNAHCLDFKPSRNFKVHTLFLYCREWSGVNRLAVCRLG